MDITHTATTPTTKPKVQEKEQKKNADYYDNTFGNLKMDYSKLCNS